jgi:hypothetical protein
VRLGNDLAPFGHLADAEVADGVRLEARDVAALERDAPGARALDAGDRADERGLARPVRADDGDDLARGHLERDALERLRVAVVEVEVLDGEHQTSVSSPR